jgi:uncharacterized membrane protein YgaE (UPF0421/DUF939 family)
VTVLARIRGRLGVPELGRIAQTSSAAAISWELALQLPNHGRPFFAPIAAAISLGAAAGRRGRQAIEMVTGVALGILVGAVLIAVAGAGWWQILVGTAVSLVLATGAGAPPMVRNQAAASTILVVALHVPGSNQALQRLVDALIGGSVAIVFARILFPVEPVELVRAEARALRASLADGLEHVADALAARDRARAQAALARIDAIDERKLGQALMLARDVARVAPRRRPLRRRIEVLGTLYRELEASVSVAHAVATGALRLLAQPGTPPSQAVAAARAAAASVRAVEPPEARLAADRAHAAVRELAGVDGSLGAGVIGHAVASIAAHALVEADAREQERRLTGTRPRRRRLRRPSRAG